MISTLLSVSQFLIALFRRGFCKWFSLFRFWTLNFLLFSNCLRLLLLILLTLWECGPSFLVFFFQILYLFLLLYLRWLLKINFALTINAWSLIVLLFLVSYWMFFLLNFGVMFFSFQVLMLMELISFLWWMDLLVSFIKLLLSIHSLIDRLVFSNTSDMPRSHLILVIFTTVVSLVLCFLLMQVCHTAVFKIKILLWILILNFMLWMFTVVLLVSNLW
jgi:hypothetical protein